MSKELNTYCGLVEIIGRSNVGKSTLFNQLIGKKLSIVSNKLQTTRYSVIGIYTSGLYKIFYKDNPGILDKCKKLLSNNLFSVTLNDLLISKLSSLIIFVVEGIVWTNDDQVILNQLINVSCPVILLINKVDKIFNKKLLLPHMHFLNSKMNFYTIFPICAMNNVYISEFIDIIKSNILLSKHAISNVNSVSNSEKFLASEIIREKLMWFLYQELPYFIKVDIEFFIKDVFSNYKICGLILVKYERHKRMIIGKRGHKIKQISTAARHDMERLFGSSIYLKIWIKVQCVFSHDKKETIHNFHYV